MAIVYFRHTIKKYADNECEPYHDPGIIIKEDELIKTIVLHSFLFTNISSE